MGAATTPEGFDLLDVMTILEKTSGTLDSLLGGLPERMASLNEGPDTWSPLDIMGHFIHGEHTDWIPRIKIVLFEEDKGFEPFDRFGFEQYSAGKTLPQLLEEFRTKRGEGMQELKSLNLQVTDYKKTGIHPEFGPVSIANILSAWAAHDLGHIYQISRVLAKQFKMATGPWPKYLRVLTD